MGGWGADDTQGPVLDRRGEGTAHGLNLPRPHVRASQAAGTSPQHSRKQDRRSEHDCKQCGRRRKRKDVVHRQRKRHGGARGVG